MARRAGAVRALESAVLAHDSCAASRAIRERSAVMETRLHCLLQSFSGRSDTGGGSAASLGNTIPALSWAADPADAWGAEGSCPVAGIRRASWTASSSGSRKRQGLRSAAGRELRRSDRGLELLWFSATRPYGLATTARPAGGDGDPPLRSSTTGRTVHRTGD